MESLDYEHILWAVLERTTVSVEIGDPQGRLVYVNPRFTEITGYAMEDAVGRTPAELLRSNLHDPAFYEGMWKTLMSGRTWHGELISRCKDGSMVRCLTAVVPVSDGDGRIVNHVALKEPMRAADELELESFEPGRKIAVAWSELRAAERRYRAMVQAAGDAIIVLDRDSGHHVDANPAACQMFGYTVEELRRIDARTLTPPEGKAKVQALEEGIVTEGLADQPRMELRRKDGTRFYGAVRMAAYEVRGRRLIIATIRDVTEEVRREQQLAESNQLLEVAQHRLLRSERLAALGQLSATVAHEINNPLQFVDASLTELREVLQAAGVRGRAMALLADVSEGVDQISTITRDLAAFTRIDHGRHEPVVLDEVVERACRMVGNEVRHRARLELRLGARRPLVADRGKLGQLVTNLVVNAAHSIVEGKADLNRISVRTEEHAEELSLVVADTGSGIPVEVVERIFEPFFSTKATGRGSGLGLAVCWEIVRLHDGSISVHSEAGEGTTFEVRLPFDNGLVITGAEPNPTQSRHRGRILLIDDDERVLQAFARMLSRSHEVVTASQGDEALYLLERDRDFDMILCDLMMPVMDGPAIHRALAELAPELLERIVFCSGGAFTPRAQEFLASVPNLLLRKPLRRAELEGAIERMMTRTRSASTGS